MGRLGAVSGPPLRPSWRRPGAVLGRVWAVLVHWEAVLGSPWARLVPDSARATKIRTASARRVVFKGGRMSGGGLGWWGGGRTRPQHAGKGRHAATDANRAPDCLPALLHQTRFPFIAKTCLIEDASGDAPPPPSFVSGLAFEVKPSWLSFAFVLQGSTAFAHI